MGQYDQHKVQVLVYSGLQLGHPLLVYSLDPFLRSVIGVFSIAPLTLDGGALCGPLSTRTSAVISGYGIS